MKPAAEKSRAVTIRMRCPDPECRAPIMFEPASVGPRELKCPRCGKLTTADVPTELGDERRVVRCACCPGREFFIRKDFPQRLGLILVIVFGIIASCFYYMKNIPMTFVVLASLVLVDAIIYLVVPSVTVCYRCRAEYRRVGYNPEHAGFDLATSEKYG
ncbi:MAG: hypothetical protein KF841_05295 [Phycisphaerae bacterium]|nr:hypothetical protein [Phycisphaerae bacterium]